MTSHQKVYKRLPELLYEVKSSLATKDFFHMYAVRVSQPCSYAPPSFLSFAVKRSVYIYIYSGPGVKVKSDVRVYVFP